MFTYRIVFFIADRFRDSLGSKIEAEIDASNPTKALIAALKKSKFSTQVWRVEVYLKYDVPIAVPKRKG